MCRVAYIGYTTGACKDVSCPNGTACYIDSTSKKGFTCTNPCENKTCSCEGYYCYPVQPICCAQQKCPESCNTIGICQQPCESTVCKGGYHCELFPLFTVCRPGTTCPRPTPRCVKNPVEKP